MVDLSIIIVLYNEYKELKRCIKSIYNNKIKNFEMIIVHNPSGRKGVEDVLKLFPKIKYIKNNRNIGFGSAANVGIKNARAPFVLVLTPDTQLLPDTISPTLSYIKTNSDVGWVGCRVFSYPKTFSRSCFYDFPNLLTHIYEYNIPFYKFVHLFKKGYVPTMYSDKAHKHQMSVKHMVGAYLLLRKSAVKKIGLFDGRFFLYREETDLSKRLYENGWKIVYLPVGGIVHYGGGSTRVTIAQSSPHYLRSTYLFFKKHHTQFYTFLAWAIGLTSSIVSIIYLFSVGSFRKLLHQPSQSFYLLRCWIRILIWHIKEGASVLAN